MISRLDLLIGDPTIVKLCSWLLILFLFLNIRGAFQKGAIKGTGYFLLLIVMILYCVFYAPTSGDNYSSMNSYYLYLSGVDYEKLHFEKIYFYLMNLIPYGYVYYRFVVWGAACLLCVWLLKRMGVSAQIATLSILTFALPLLLYYQRAAFAYVLLYIALLCYVTKGESLSDNKLLRKNYRIVSILLLLCTLPFHTTMPVYVFLVLYSILIPKNKLGLAILIVSLIVFSSSLISNSISMLEFFQEETLETGLRSLENDSAIVGQNFMGSIAYFIHWLPLYCMLIYGIFRMVATPNHQTQFEKACLVNTLVLLAISIMFMPYSFTIQIKFRNVAMMPWSLYIASYYMRYSGSKACSLYALSTIPTFFI